MPDTPTLTHTPAQTRRIAQLRILSLSLTLALIVLGVGWEWQWAPVRAGGSTLVIKVLPLCLALAGLLKHKLYTYRWLSLLVWLYVAEGGVRLWSDTGLGQQLAWLELLLGVALFVALASYIRLRLRVGKA